MNWEAIGAVGEVLGALGVIITLAYLAVQIRQNSHQLERSFQATRVTADDAVARGFDHWRQLLISDSNLSDIFIRGMEDISALDPNERLRFNNLLSTFAWTAWQTWRSEDLINDPNRELYRHLLIHRGARQWYGTYREFFPADFRAMLDGVQATLESEGIEHLGQEDSSSMFGGLLASVGSRGGEPARPSRGDSS